MLALCVHIVRMELIISYKVALEQVPVARKLAAKHDILFTRPTDYYAEMVKSDEHMERIRTKLVDEAYAHLTSPLTVKTDNIDKESRNPKLPNDNEISRSTENRFKFKRSNSERWTRNRSRTKSRVSRGVRLRHCVMWIQLTIIERSEGAELGDEFEIDIDNSEDKPQRGGASARGRGGKTSVSLSFYLSGHALHIRPAIRPHLYLQDQPPSCVSS